MIGRGIHNKIKSLNELASIVSGFKAEGKTVVHCHGVFDLLHPGHIRHFEIAKQQGDISIVTITQDKFVAKGPGRPVFNESLRAESIASLEFVDYVAINQWPTSVKTIQKLKPDIYCKGSDYTDASKDITGKIHDEEEAIHSIGGHIYFTNDITFSSTKLINTYFDVFSEDTREFLRAFQSKYSARDIIKQLEALKSLKVLVIGETIIDDYHYCTPLGKSPKENLIPAKYLYAERFAGGILAIANHIAGFCNEVDVVTCLGETNPLDEFILQNLRNNIQSKFFYSPDTPTIIKRRFVETDILRKLFEVHFMDGMVLSDAMSQLVCDYLDSCIDNYDIVVVGDYGHGFLSSAIIGFLCNRAKFLAINVQTNSANIGFNLITKYSRADYFCIDEVEIRLATHDNVSQISKLLSEVALKLNCPRAVVTRGHLGSLVFDKNDGVISIPVYSREIIDRVGAGDAYLAVTSLCAAASYPSDVVGFIGNAVGALAIRIIGNKISVEPVELFKYITTLLK